MNQSKEEHVELFAILPFGKFKAMEQKVKKTETSPDLATSEPPLQPEPPLDPGTPKKVLSKEERVHTLHHLRSKVDLKTKYRTSHIKKLLDQMAGSKDITQLENLDELIRCALTGSRKTLANEEKFFQFLFENNLGHFVKNRSKINLYYQGKDNWFYL